MIQVERVDENTYRVTVDEGSSRTEHTVTVREDYYKKLTGGIITPEVLVRNSFEFLLEREPKESILSTFDLRVIQRYFSNYEQVIRGR